MIPDLTPAEVPGLSSWASLSEDEKYRYLLGREVGGGRPGTLLFIMLNPSTADSTVNDPTIRRCISFTRREGLNLLEVVNLYALRATNPKALRTAWAPAGGPRNLETIRSAVARATTICYAWGSLGEVHVWRAIHDEIVVPSGKTPMCLGQTKYGQPRHPLYIKGTQPLVPFVVK